jgi:ribonuclease HI
MVSPSIWSPPPPRFYKINFDGTSKGNSGPSGSGAVIRDNHGRIHNITAENLGFDTNNSVKI